MEYKYTIIIPHKNIPSLLKRCLSSIPTREDVQVIVADDNSYDLDAVKNILRQFHEIELLTNREPNGAGHARNICLQKAKGKWLLFADADDFFSSSFFDIIDSHYKDDADIVYFAADSLYSESLNSSPKLDNRKRAIERYLSNPRKLEDFCRYFHTEPWGKMIRRSMVEQYKIKFDETPLANDYYFSIATGYYAQKIVYDNRVVYMYTEREGSLSHKYTGDENALKTRLEVYKRVQDFFDKHNIPYAPFYRYSFSESFNKDRSMSNLVKTFWKTNSISIWVVLYRYIKGKIYQYTMGVHL